MDINSMMQQFWWGRTSGSEQEAKIHLVNLIKMGTSKNQGGPKFSWHVKLQEVLAITSESSILGLQDCKGKILPTWFYSRCKVGT